MAMSADWKKSTTGRYAMVLVSQQDVVKMNFNLETIEVEGVAKFMRRYLAILQLAFFYNFITEQQRDSIASSILQAARNSANENEVVVSNYVYAISLRFSTLSNYECWELLREVTSISAAEKFVAESKEWFVNRILEDMKQAKEGYKKSISLKNASLLSTWKSCYKSLEEISGCFNEAAKLELKSLHTESAAGNVFYMIIRGEKGITYIEKVESYMRNLWIEISILVKFNAGKIMKAIANERTEFKVALQNETTPQIEQAQRDYDSAVKRLSELEKSYEEMLNRMEESEAVYNELLEKFEDEHPELDEDDLYDAFDEYWMNSPYYFSEDRSEMEDAFKERRTKLQEEINICRQKVDWAEDHKASVECSMVGEENGDYVSLLDILNEYAVVEMFKKGIIPFPQNLAEKMAIFSKLSLKEVTKIFLDCEAERIHLTAEEMTYLLH